MDRLNKILAAAAVILWLVSRFLSGGLRTLAFYLFLFFAGICIYRALSRNLARRSEENQRLEQWARTLRDGSETLNRRKEQRAEYKIFKCPGCGMKMRVPRGQGKVRVTCRQCGAIFEKKT